MGHVAVNVGGGRIIGEACHLIDLCIFFTGSLVKSVCMSSMSSSVINPINDGTILLKFENGSNASINYFTNGSKSYSKERVEVYSQEKTWIIDNYRKTVGFGSKNFKKLSTKIDKGHNEQFKKYIKSINDGNGAIISHNEIINSSLASLLSISSYKNKSWMKVAF